MTFLLNWRILAAIILAVGMVASHLAIYKAGKNTVQVKFDTYMMAAEMASKAAIEQAQKTEQKWNEKLNQERNNAVKREIQLRKDADLANDASDGLRNQLSATARRIAQAPSGSCVDYSTKLADVLIKSTEEYTRVAEDADRWESYAMMCHDSWPN